MFPKPCRPRTEGCPPPVSSLFQPTQHASMPQGQTETRTGDLTNQGST